MQKKLVFKPGDWKIHPSYRKNMNFQRLEFFGDKIVSFEISKLLLEDEDLTEGDLSIILSKLVCRDTMAIIGKFLIPHIKYTGKLTNSMLASTLEAWIAYEYYRNKQNISKIIYDLWRPHFHQKFHSNIKNIVQEFAQRENYKITYDYEFITNNFLCTLYIDELKFTAFGMSKKEASEKAAEKMAKYLNI